jgi:hypothetical protein
MSRTTGTVAAGTIGIDTGKTHHLHPSHSACNTRPVHPVGHVRPGQASRTFAHVRYVLKAEASSEH